MVPQDKKIQDLFETQQDQRYKSRTSSCSNNKIYVGNSNDIYVVVTLWIVYIIGSAYFLAVVSPYLWVKYSPAITIVGIFVSIPGLYNAIKCYFTVCNPSYPLYEKLDPGVLKKGTCIKEEQNDLENKIVQQQVQQIQNKEQKEDNVINTTEHQKVEILVETQKIVINEKSVTMEQNKEQPIQILVDEINEKPENQDLKISPKIEVELIKDDNKQIEQQTIDEWVMNMKKGLTQIQNGLNDCDQQLQKVGEGLSEFQNNAAFTLNHDTSQLPVFINPFPVKQSSKQQQGGNLFEERYCHTCKLIRPPLASHCYFMGNCIGQRNHKNFYLFLWGTLVWTIYIMVFTIISFVDNIKENNFVFVQFYENSVLFYFFVAIVGFALILFILRLNEDLTKVMLIPTSIITIISYVWIASYQNIKYYENPVIPLLGIIIDICAIIAVCNFAIYDCFLACIGSTIKQQSFKTKNQIEQTNFTFSKGCATYYKFLAFNPPPSDILDQ